MAGVSQRISSADAGRAWPPLVDLATWPSIVFVYIFLLLQYGGVDEWVARLFYDPVHGLFPLKHDFWTEQVLHDGARQLMMALGLVAVALWAASFRYARLMPWRRDLSYGLLVVLLSVVFANLGKEATNIDCPWDLAEFGGARLHFGLFADKPDDLARGRCFPAGHSSAGFALFALFFVARRRGYRPAWPSLLPALLIGGLFAFDQWVRGAHFPSHDLTTAYLCWMTALGIHAWFWGRGEHGEQVTQFAPGPGTGTSAGREQGQ